MDVFFLLATGKKSSEFLVRGVIKWSLDLIAVKICVKSFFSLQMSHTKPYIRKKAVLIMYKVFLKYPESLRPAFPRLKEKLEDPDPG